MEGMHRLNVTILDGADKLTHWTGSPSAEGGALKSIDMSPVGGPPVFDYDTTGNDREQLKFNLETKIPGRTEALRKAFILKYARGTRFIGAKITGMPGDETADWVVENALIRHNADDGPSTLAITLAEASPSTLEADPD